MRPVRSPVRSLPFAALLAAWSMVGGPPVRADAVADVVITEIMYNPASGDRREDFIELHNKGSASYNLSGWRFEDGVSYTFGNVNLGAGQYLVVCADQDRIRQLHGIANTVGNWDPVTTLDNGGERIRLLDGTGLEIEDLTFDDRNPWPILADGYGHSLEKRNPDGDNDEPANWTASAVGSGWTRVAVTGLATSSTIYIYLADAGTAYIDDLRLHPLGNPGDNRIQNGGFETGLPPFTASGNHSGSVSTTERARTGARSLKLVATGPGTGASTAVVQANLGLVVDAQYTLEFWVFLTQPGQRVISRLSMSAGQADPIYLEAGGGGATPGRVNSMNSSDIPPFVYPAFQLPETPIASETVALQAVVADDRAVSQVLAYWNAGAGELSAPMFDDGAHQDGAPGDGLYGARIGSFPTGTIVRFHITATDGAGQLGRFPFLGNPTPVMGFYIEPPGINPAFQARSNSGLVSDRPPVYHFLLSSQAEAQLASSPATYVRGTFIYNGEVFENVRIRHRGQSSLGTPKKHWKVDFNKDHRFRTPFEDHREVDNLNLQSAYGDKSFLREWLAYKAWMDVGQPGLEMWHVRLYLNGAYRGFYVHLENPDGDWLDRTGLDPEGWLWKAYSQARGGTGGFEPEEMGEDAVAANAALGDFMDNMNILTQPALTDYIQDTMDVPSFIDFLAIHQLIHNCDHPAKNYLVYGDEDAPEGTWTYLGWDMDLTHGRNYECAGGGVYNDTIRFDMFGDRQLLFGTSVRPKCDGPWNGVINAFLQRTPSFREAFYVRTAELLEQLYRPAVMNALIDGMAGPLLQEMELDWNRNPPGYGARATAQHHVNQLKGFVQNRYNYLQSALADLTAPDLSDLACNRAGNDLVLDWVNNDARYTAIRVYRNQTLLRVLAGSVETFTAPLDLGQALNSFRVASVFNGVERPGRTCTVIISTGDYATVIDEDFSPPASSADLSVNCAAQQVNGVLQLTPPTGSLAGSAFFRSPLPVADFIADFDLRFDDPSNPGADGMVFAMSRGGDPAVCGAGGGALGFWQADAGGVAIPGYGVVFDTWQNAGEPSHNWVGFIDTARQGSGAFAATALPEELTANGTFHARVTGKDGTFSVLLSNPGIGMAEREILRYTAPGFTPEDVRFGFTAGTGGAVSRHIVDNFVLQVRGETPPPAAAFKADLTSGEAPLTVAFTNESTGAASYRWTFGDGVSSVQASPTHTYQSPGVYTVSLTATGPSGSDVETRVGYITATATLEADFTTSVTTGTRPLLVRFTDQTRSNVPITGYSWEFGDGATSNFSSPTRTYGPGEFTVTLRVTAQGGLSSTRTRVNYIQVDDLLSADFGAQPASGPAPLNVRFSDASSGSTIQRWSWNFGDGGTASVRSPSHVYTAPGRYTVRLAISGYQAAQVTEKPAFITVTAPGGLFRRGDSNDDQDLDISDPIATLAYLFTGGSEPRCQDSMDANDDGDIDISDAIAVLNLLFTGGATLPPPFPDPGPDPTPDDIPPCAGP